MRSLVCGVVVLVASGCFRDEAPLSARTVEASAEGYSIEVKTLPGLEVDVQGQRVIAGDDGLARVKLSVASLSYAKNMSDLSVMARGRKGLTRYFASGRVDLPFSPEVAEKLPQGDGWLRVLGGGSKGVSGGSLWWFGAEVGGALLAADGSLTLEVLSMPNARVRIAGHEAKANEMGRSELSFTTSEVFAMIDVLRLHGTDDEPVEASVNGKELALKAKWTMSVAQLRPALEKPLGGRRSKVPMVLFFDSRGSIASSGRDGKLNTLDVVAVGTAQPPRKMSPCDGYHRMKLGEVFAKGPAITLEREAIDEEVVARDAQSGKELGRKRFTAQDFCPNELGHNDDVLKNTVNDDEVTAWLKTL